MAQTHELVSVIIPAYNAELTLDETLDSARQQTYSPLEIIVVDDGSTDRTRLIAEHHAAADRRLRVISQNNSGVAAARNLGIAAARGALVAPLDSDDLWRPDKIARQVAALHEDERAALVYTWAARIDENGCVIDLKHRPESCGDAFAALCRQNLIGNGSSALMRKSVVLDVGGYDPSLRARGMEGCEDYKLYLQIAEHHRIALVKDHLTGYRRVPSNMSSRVMTMLRSFDAVAAEVAARYPEHRERLHESRNLLLRWLLRRTLEDRKPSDAMKLTAEMLRHDASWTLLTLASLGRDLAVGPVLAAVRKKPSKGATYRPFLQNLARCS